ncbi:MAG: hypothetical protein ACXAD7_28385, partial [Candidatus Kariarchaeaceae archaeon]
GWAHSANIYIDTSPEDGVIVIDGKGRHTKYFGSIEDGFERPSARHADLIWSYSGAFPLGFYHFILKYDDGSRIHFHESPSDEFAPHTIYHIKKSSDRHSQRTDYDYYQEPIEGGEGYWNSALKTITLPNDNKINFDYFDGSDRIKSIIDRGITEFSYSDGSLNTIKINDVIKADFSYDLEGRLNGENLDGIIYTSSYGDYERYLYDGLGNVMYHLVSDVGFPSERPVFFDFEDGVYEGHVTVTDGNSNRWYYTHNEYGQITKIEAIEVIDRSEVYHTVKEIGYYESGNGARLYHWVKNAKGDIRSYEYDSYNNLISFTNEEDQTIEYQYNDLDFPGRITDKIRNGLTIFHYDYDWGYLETVTDASGNVTSYSYEFYEKSTLINGVVYIEHGVLKSKTKTDRNGHRTFWGYNTKGRLEEIKTYVFLDSSWVYKTTYDYSGAWNNRVKTEYIHLQSNDKLRVDYYYDEWERLSKKIVDPYNLHLVDEYQYIESSNRMSIWRNPNGVETKYDYDHRGRLTTIINDYGGSNERVTLIEYDGNRKESITVPYDESDSENNKTMFYYDHQNRLIKIINAEDYATWYDLDPNGNRELVTKSLRPLLPGEDLSDLTEDEKREVGFEYDTLDRVTKIIQDPNGLHLETIIEYLAGLNGCDCSGTDRDLIHRIIDAEGKTTIINYDVLERATEIIRHVGILDEDPDSGDDVVTRFTYDAEGNIIKTVGPEGEISEFEYDAADRVI